MSDKQFDRLERAAIWVLIGFGVSAVIWMALVASLLIGTGHRQRTIISSPSYEEAKIIERLGAVA